MALAEAAAHAKELETTVAELKAQLDELVTSKQDDETALLLKFRDLLNEKKIKIREQQKVLAAGPFQNSQSASQRFSQPLDSQPSRTPAPSRPRKRKVQAVEPLLNELEENETEMDKIKSEPQDSEQEDTAEDTASGGSDDDDDDNDDEGDDGNDRSRAGVDNSSRTAPKAPSPAKKSDEQVPAPRSLPFTKKAAAKALAADMETDSGDEL